MVKNCLPVQETKDSGLNPGSGISLGGGHGNLFQYSCLDNPMDRVAWWAMFHSVRESDVTEGLSTQTHSPSGKALQQTLQK